MEGTSADPKPEQLMTCPYNMSHQIQRSRMQYHLTKCRKQYPDCNKVPCEFDATHMINDVELDFHLTVCAKRLMLDTMLFVYENTSTVEFEQPPVVQCDEDWDDDAPASYKPDPTKKVGHIFTKPKCITRSERVKVRQEGIRKYNNLNNKNDSDQ